MGMLPESSRDRRLLSHAAKKATPNEMSEAVLGELTPAECVERVKELLASKDIWNQLEERQLLMYQMQEHLDWLKRHRDDPKMAASITRMFKLVSDSLEKARINLSDVSTKLSTEHARYFVDGFMLGFDRLLEKLEERDMIIAEEEVEAFAAEAISASQEYLEKVTQKSG